LPAAEDGSAGRQQDPFRFGMLDIVLPPQRAKPGRVGDPLREADMVSLESRTALVFGVANKRSIAWGIARKLHEAGAQLAIVYQNERLRPEAEELTASLLGAQAFQCDVSRDDDVETLFAQIRDRYGKLHILVHSIAYALPEDLRREFLHTSREGFRIAHDVSVYSLIALARAAAPLMSEGGSILTMTYYGAEKVVPHYNVMGVAKAALEATVRYLAYDLGKHKVRVNAISAGPIKTLAARGIAGLSEMLEVHAARAPLLRNIDVDEVAAAGLFLASDLSSGITGETLFVDCGYNIMGL
jgi:enoyl-[acyl-carrier protein] reductase I